MGVAVDMDVDDPPPSTAAEQGAKVGGAGGGGGLVSLDRGTAIKVTPLYGVQGTSFSLSSLSTHLSLSCVWGGEGGRGVHSR